MLDLKEAAADTVLAHPDLGTNKSRLLEARLRRGGHRRQRRRGHRQGARRRHRHRARVPPAAAHPGLHGAPLDRRRPDRRADDRVVGHPGAAHPALRHRRDDGHPRVARCASSPPTSVVASAASCRPRPRSSSPSPSPAGSASRASSPRPARESLMSAHHGRDQWQKLTLSAREGRHGHRASRSSCSPTWAPTSRIVGGGVPVLGAWMFNSIYKFPAYQFNCQTVLHQQDLGRRLPRRRAARRRPTPSSGSWTSSPSRSVSTRSRSARRTGSRTTSSRSPRWPGMTYDSGNYEAATAKAVELFGYDELRAEQKRRRDSNDPVQLGIGVSTFTEMCGLAPSRVLGLAELRRRRLGARQHPDARHRQGRGHHRRVRRTARATRRRGARSSPTGSACRSRTSRCCTATPRSRRRAWTPTARGRSSSVVRRWSRRPTRSSRRPSRSRRTCSRPASTTSSSRGGRFTVKGTDKGVGDRRDRARDLRRRTTCPTASSRASTPTPPTTR